MQLKKLKDSIKGLADVFEAGGSRVAAKDISKISEALVGPDQRNCEDALKELRDSIELSEQARVTEYVKRLNAAKTNREKFEAIHNEISKDRTIVKADLDRIMFEYSGGGRKKWSTRKAALDAIKKKFNERAYRDSKMKIVEKTRVW